MTSPASWTARRRSRPPSTAQPSSNGCRRNMLLAELNVRHTRRHMPTRRVALDGTYLPTSGPGYGAVLLGAVVAEHKVALDEEQLEMLPRLVRDARDGLHVPRIALRYRLQTDTHGLDRSRHRLVGGDDGSLARRVGIAPHCPGRSAPQGVRGREGA